MKRIKAFIISGFLLTGICFSQVYPEDIIEEIILDEEFEIEEEEYVPPQTPPRDERGEIYFDPRELDSSFKDKYKDSKFDYHREPEPKSTVIREPLFNLSAGIIRFLSYAVVGLVIFAVIYQILKNSGGFIFGRDSRRIKVDTEEFTEEDEEDIRNNDFPELIRRAKEQKDYRRAVRYYYLWVLQSLSDKNLIRWNKDKTDHDYFLELGQNPIKDDFFRNTYVYDHVWYGKFQMSDREFNLAENIFKNTLNKLK